MNDIERRHALLEPLDATDTTYGELAAYQLRRIIYDLGIHLTSPHPLDVATLQQRVVFTLTLLEAHDSTIPRYNIDSDMPMSAFAEEEDA